jgi:hypothetical protein
MSEDQKAPSFEPLVRADGFFTELSPEAYRAAAEPFPVSVVEWRVVGGGKTSDNGIVAPYADPRHYLNRLRQLFGPNASLTVRPWQASGSLMVARLEVCGVVFEDVGEKEGGNNSLTSSHAQAVKRVCSTALGMGTYFYIAFPQIWVKLKKVDKYRFPHPEEYGKLRQAAQEASENWRQYLDGDLSVTGRDYYALLDIEAGVEEAELEAAQARQQATADEQARRKLQASSRPKAEAASGPVVAAGKPVAPAVQAGEPTEALAFEVNNTATVAKHTGKSQKEHAKVTLRDLVATEDGRGYLKYVQNNFNQAGAKEAATAVLEWWESVGVDGLNVPGAVVSGGTDEAPSEPASGPQVGADVAFEPSMTNMKALVAGLGLEMTEVGWAWDTLTDEVDGIWKDKKMRGPDDTDAWKAAFEWLKLKSQGGKATSTVPFDQSPR